MIEVIGHDHVKQLFLMKDHPQDVLGGVWILSGLWGIGKTTLAGNIAAEILAKQSGIPLKIVSNWVDNRAHPHLTWIDRSMISTSSKELGIDHISPIFSNLAYAPAQNEWRVVVIDDSDHLNRFGANTLLKILEDLPSRTTVLLISHYIGRMIATIRSRGCVVAMKSLSLPEMERVLAMHGWPHHQTLLNLAAGRPGLYRQLQALGGEDFLNVVRQVFGNRRPGLYEFGIKLLADGVDVQTLFQAIIHVVGHLIVNNPQRDRCIALIPIYDQLMVLGRCGYQSHLDPKMVLQTMESLGCNT